MVPNYYPNGQTYPPRSVTPYNQPQVTTNQAYSYGAQISSLPPNYAMVTQNSAYPQRATYVHPQPQPQPQPQQPQPQQPQQPQPQAGV